MCVLQVTIAIVTCIRSLRIVIPTKVGIYEIN